MQLYVDCDSILQLAWMLRERQPFYTS